MSTTTTYKFDPARHKRVSDVRYFNALNGYNWFSRDTMRFFGSRIETRNLIGGRYFITSEDNFDCTSREFRIRRVTDDFGIETIPAPMPINGVDTFRTLVSAKAYLRKLIERDNMRPGKVSTQVNNIGFYSGGNGGIHVTDEESIRETLHSLTGKNKRILPDSMIIADNGDIWGISSYVPRLDSTATYLGNINA